MKHKYIITTIDTMAFSGFASPFAALDNPVKYLNLVLDHTITADEYSIIASEQYRNNKRCVLSITEVGDNNG